MSGRTGLYCMPPFGRMLSNLRKQAQETGYMRHLCDRIALIYLPFSKVSEGYEASGNLRGRVAGTGEPSVGTDTGRQTGPRLAGPVSDAGATVDGGRARTCA